MANNLLKAGFALSVYNRSSAKAEALAAKGASWVTTPAEATQGDVVITMLVTDAAVESVVFGADGVLGALRPSAIHVSMSTMSVALADRLTEKHHAKKQGFVSAPVFGRPEGRGSQALCRRGWSAECG
jgi:3-hydroxyisobutyrate dehydrogenase-like beta-hydroxyacid dehydrogenase